MLKRTTGTRVAAALACTLIAGGTLAACSAEAAGGDILPNGDPKSIDVVVFSGWPEGIAVSELWRAALESEGYDVTLTTADAAPAYLGLAKGEYDIVLDSWMPVTHEAYWDKYGDKLENLVAWYTDARNTMVVNQEAPIESLDELADHADEFGGRIVGMEPGAGLTKITEESVIPGYGLEDMDFITSSTPALLAEIKGSTGAGENVVATLARPHWAYDAFPIRDLEDPEGAFGGAEEIRTTARAGFEEDYPNAARWLSEFEMGDEYLLPLCNLLFNLNEGKKPGPIVDEWVADNQEWVDSLTES